MQCHMNLKYGVISYIDIFIDAIFMKIKLQINRARLKANALVSSMLGTVRSHQCGSCDRKGTICVMETLSLIMNKKLIHLLLYTCFNL